MRRLLLVFVVLITAIRLLLLSTSTIALSNAWQVTKSFPSIDDQVERRELPSIVLFNSDYNQFSVFTRLDNSRQLRQQVAIAKQATSPEYNTKITSQRELATDLNWQWVVTGIVLVLIALSALVYVSVLIRNLILSNKKLKQEIELRVEVEKRLMQQALYDPLTEIPNRTLLSDRLQQAVYNAKRDASSFALALIDLNDFKEINDNYGHDIGDQVLQQIARRFIGLVRKTDTIARIGGDEFVLLILNIDDIDAIIKIVEKTLALVEQTIVVQDYEFQISASAGISRFPIDGTEPAELLKCADMAMYQAKRAGTGQLRLWSAVN